MPDGSKAADTWKLVSGKWYYFDGSGSRVKGWLQTGGRWYYMDQGGAMCTGWLSPGDGFWYYLGTCLRAGYSQALESGIIWNRTGV